MNLKNHTLKFFFFCCSLFCLMQCSPFFHGDKKLKNRHNEEGEGKKMRPDRPDLAFLQDFKRTKDPATGTIPHERAIQAFQYTKRKLKEKAAITGVNWTERGPNNIGGRTRALMYDPNDAANGYKKVWAGGVAGGLWYNNDITDANSSWTNVNDFWANMAISSIAYAPNNTQTFYVGTGEGWFNGGAVKGNGIWKTTDGGGTWNVLASTVASAEFPHVNKLVVTSGGVILAGTRGDFINRGGIQRSTDGGTTWTNVLAPYRNIGVTDGATYDWCADIEIAANGDIYASFALYTTSKLYKSTNNGATWTELNYGAATGTPARIEIATAPNDANTLYIVGYNAAATNDNDVSFFKKSVNAGSTWSNVTIPRYITSTATCVQSSTHFTRKQCWYDLILKVHPTNKDLVIAGGIDLIRTLNGTAATSTWAGISYWTGVTCGLSIVHADQHAIAFHPTDPNKVIFGNDGGVFYSADAGNSSVATPTISGRNKNYNVTQFYAVGTKNVSNSSFFVAGAQDNGSLITNGFQAQPAREGTGGDGAFCFVDQNEPNIVITAYTNNNYYLSTDGGYSFPTILLSAGTGDFINTSTYDNTNNILYTHINASSIYRVTGIGGTPASATVDFTTALSSTITAMKMSPYTANLLYIGTDDGNIYTVAGANTGTSKTPTKITTTALASGTVSSIDIGASDNQIMVTLSNYGINSVFETLNGGTSWTNKDTGSLPDMPIRWGLYNPSNFAQVLLATEAGIYSTDNFNGTPVWGPTTNALANVRCDMLQYRAIDKVVVVATHARGIFTTDVWSSALADFDYTQISCNTIRFNDGSLKPNNSWAWDINGDGVTDYTTQNPTHTYTTAGVYSVRLAISNGTITTTKNSFITITGTAPATSSCAVVNNSNMGNGLGFMSVVLNTISNDTPPDNGSYQDYSCSKSTTLIAGTSYTISLKVGDGTNAMGTRLFIDYNNDGDFADAGENVTSTTSSVTIAQSLTFTPPATATKNTNLRLRIVSKFGGIPTSCSDVSTYGQVEDYTIIVSDAISWTGNTNTDWSNTGNWSSATIPTSFNNITIPTGRPNYPNITTNTPVCNNLTIDVGGSITLGNNGSLRAGGTFNCAGTITYAGTTAQNTLASKGTITGTMVINNSQNVTLLNDHTISGTLNVQNGKLLLNYYDIDFGTIGTLIENRANNAIVTDYTPNLHIGNKGGYLRFSNRITNGTLTQIAGTGIHLANAGTVTIDRYHYRGAVSGFSPGGTIKKVYEITGTPTSATMRIEFANDERFNMISNGTNTKLFKHNGTNWISQGGTWTGASYPHYVELTSISSFSPWTVGNNTNPLPIELMRFDALRTNDENVSLSWNTLTETNNQGFEVERSFDGQIFEKIAFLDGLGTSSTGKSYTFQDTNKEASYYRLKQIDFNKSFGYSDIRFVEGSGNENMIIYPNPTTENISLKLPKKINPQETGKMRIVDLQGKEIKVFEGKMSQTEAFLKENITLISAGTYIVEISTNNGKFKQKLVKL
jgi:PKD repeat protein